MANKWRQSNRRQTMTEQATPQTKLLEASDVLGRPLRGDRDALDESRWEWITRRARTEYATTVATTPHSIRSGFRRFVDLSN